MLSSKYQGLLASREDGAAEAPFMLTGRFQWGQSKELATSKHMYAFNIASKG
jgi:hypothetical protein